MSNLSPRKVISLAILLSFIIMQFSLISLPVSAQGKVSTNSTPQPTFAPPSPTPTANSEPLPFDAQSVSSLATTSNTGWSTPLNISTTDSNSESPSIAVDATGVIHVVWSENVSNGLGEIFYKYKNATGWSAPINVSNSSIFDSNSPQVVADNNGAYIIWDERDSDFYSGNSEIFFSKCSYGICITPLTLSDSLNWECGKYSSYPHPEIWANDVPILAVDQGNQLMAEWRAYEGGEITMPYSVWSGSGLPPSRPTGCVPKSTDVMDRHMGSSRLSGGTSGNFALIFDERRNDNSQGVYYSRYSNGSWTTPSFLGTGSRPDLFLDRGTDDLHLTWCDSNGDLQYWSSTGSIQMISGGGCNWHAPIARDINGLMRVVWEESGQIYESRKVSEFWSTQVNISQSGAAAYTPDMVADGRGGLHLVWQGVYNGNNEIFYLTDPAYDCSATSLSTIGQAVLGEVDQQNYCLNKFKNFTFIEDPDTGAAAFSEFAELAEQTEYELDFATMIWDIDAGEIFLGGIKNLYTKIKTKVENDPTAYPEGIRIRIFLGLEHYCPIPRDQRITVLNSLNGLEIPLDDLGGKWKVEVAADRSSKQDGCYERPNYHSHVKVLIVDGKEAIVSGYNTNDANLDSRITDVGVRISGPIVQDALQVFDQLWLDARGLTCFLVEFCEYLVAPSEHASAVKLIEPAVSDPINIFSLFRNSYDKTADNAASQAISSATTKINILQNRYFENDPPKCNDVGCYYWPVSLPTMGEQGPFPYTQSIIDAAQNGAQIRMLLGPEAVEKRRTEASIENLRRAILLLPDGENIIPNITVKYSKDVVHAKAYSVDGKFVVVGSQNFDFSAFGDDPTNIMDLAEYSLGIDSETVTDEFDRKFDTLWNDAVASDRVDQSVQQTINQAAPGTIVFIPSGTYQEEIIVDKPLTLIGEDANGTIIASSGNQPAIRVMSSDVEISNLRISGSAGYGIELVGSSSSSPQNLKINWVVFENNAQGGVLVQGLTGGSPTKYTIENNTFIGGADGITINMPETQADTSIIRNNIFSGQSTAPIHILSSDDSRVEYSYNLFDDCGTGSCVASWRSGNMSAVSTEHDNLFDLDPLFVDAANGAYQLSAGSPAIDAGDPSLLHESFYDGDYDGMAQIDMGAFEYIDESAPTVSSVHIASVQQGTVNFTVTFSEPVTGVDPTDFILTKTNAPDAAISSVSGSEGTYTVSVSIGTGDGTIRLDVVDDDTILDFASNPLNSGFTGGEPYTIPSCNLVTHSPEFRFGNTMYMTITNPTGVALNMQDVFVKWDHDRGHAYGNDKSLVLQKAALGSTTLWSGSQAGPTYTFSTAAAIPTGTSTLTFTFHQTYDSSDGSENIQINLATDGCEAYPIDSNNTLTETPGAQPGAQIDTVIGGVKQGSVFVYNNTSQLKSYAGVSTGPVKILSTNGVPVIGAERVIYTVNGVETSYSEMMGLPNSQVDTTFWFPSYNNVDFDSQLRFGNVSNATATIHVYVGGSELAGSPFTLAAGKAITKNFAGVNGGPAKVVSNVPIVVAERVFYEVNGVNTSFSEMMGLPNSRLNKIFWLPWYYYSAGVNTELLFANVSNSTATIRVYAGGVELTGSPFTLAPGTAKQQKFTGIDTGPVKIVSNVNIVASERVIYKVGGVETSYSEMMGLPNSQVDTTLWMPLYNNIDFDSQLRIANASSSTATVHVYAGGAELTGSPLTLAVGSGIKKNFSGVNGGPLKIVSNMPIVVSKRMIDNVDGVNTSFSEIMGLPDYLLDTLYWMPWYNNVGLNTQLILGVGDRTGFEDEVYFGMSSQSSTVLEAESMIEEGEPLIEPESIRDPFDVTIEDGSPYWQGLPIGAGQDSFVTFTNLQPPVDEPLSYWVWSEDSIQVLYDTPGQRIQIWMYAAETGWTQRGEDIPVTFADGDTFRAHALADGTVEIYRNGDLLVRQGATLGQASNQNWFAQLVSYILPSHPDQVGETETPRATPSQTSTH